MVVDLAEVVYLTCAGVVALSRVVDGTLSRVAVRAQSRVVTALRRVDVALRAVIGALSGVVVVDLNGIVTGA